MLFAVPDVQLHYPDYGHYAGVNSRRLIVVWPGFTNDVSLALRPVYDTLRQFGDVVGVQPVGLYDPALIAAATFEAIQEQGHEEVVLFGCSAGGMAVVDFVRRYGATAPFQIKLAFECAVVSLDDVKQPLRWVIKHVVPHIEGGPAFDRIWPYLAKMFFLLDKKIPLETGAKGHNPYLLAQHQHAMFHCPTRLSMSWLQALRDFEPLRAGELAKFKHLIFGYEDDQLATPQAIECQIEAFHTSLHWHDAEVSEEYGCLSARLHDYCFHKLWCIFGHDDWVEKPEFWNSELEGALGLLCDQELPATEPAPPAGRRGTRLTRRNWKMADRLG